MQQGFQRSLTGLPESAGNQRFECSSELGGWKSEAPPIIPAPVFFKEKAPLESGACFDQLKLFHVHQHSRTERTAVIPAFYRNLVRP